MARSRRKNSAQRIVGLATSGMPSPIRTVATSRLGSFLMVIGIPVLLALGILQISWNGWRPTLSVNKERAEEVRDEVREQVNKETDGLIDKWSDEWRGDERAQMLDRVRQLGEQATNGRDDNAPQDWRPGILNSPTHPTEQPEPGSRFPNLPQPQLPQPIYQPPSYQQPGYQQPGYQQPGYQAPPGYQLPAYAPPTYPQPGVPQPGGPYPSATNGRPGRY